jgi:hypothetical protein
MSFQTNKTHKNIRSELKKKNNNDIPSNPTQKFKLSNEEPIEKK